MRLRGNGIKETKATVTQVKTGRRPFYNLSKPLFGSWLSEVEERLFQVGKRLSLVVKKFGWLKVFEAVSKNFCRPYWALEGLLVFKNRRPLVDWLPTCFRLTTTLNNLELGPLWICTNFCIIMHNNNTLSAVLAWSHIRKDQSSIFLQLLTTSYNVFFLRLTGVGDPLLVHFDASKTCSTKNILLTKLVGRGFWCSLSSWQPFRDSSRTGRGPIVKFVWLS